MENFNLIEDMLKQSRVVINRRYYVVGKRGDENVMFNDVERWKGSDDRTKGEVLVYDKDTKSLDWKSLYKSSKGLYFKKVGRIYI